MWNPNIKVINIQSWCKCFSAILWVCWLSALWCNFDCSQWMSQFDSCQLQLVSLTLEHRPARNLKHKMSQTTFDMVWSVTEPSLYTAQVFFLHFSCIFNILAIIKDNMPEMLLYFFIFNIKMATQKNSPVLIQFFFFNAQWYPSCHNTV